ncbi:MAG: membrane protein insertion efficiency factor YidD [Massiliimalia sp.]
MKRLLIALIRIYQKWISPLKPACCRFYPSCSAYAVEALRRHGAVKGCILAGWRLLRCNPWNVGGIDYVPERFFLVPFHGNNHKKPEDD